MGTSTYIETSVQYDQFGNIRKSWDGNGNLSEIAYSSTYAYAYPTSTTSPVPVRSSTDSSGLHSSGSALVSSMTYDTETGLVLTKTDPNSEVTTLSYADDLNRPTSVDSPAGGRIEFVYVDTPGSLSIKTRTKLDNSHWQETTKYFDGLARPVKVKQNDSVGDTFVETKYDDMGRVWKTSNPYRSGDTVVWTETAYDNLGRVVSVTTPDGASVATEYSLLTSGGLLGVTTLVTDQASKKRKSVTDGLANLARVIEDPATLAYVTDYSYDLLGNLLTVTQVAGAVTQTRTFVYDDASRLTSAANPESGTIAYEYDSNGNLTGKTDARGIETNYFYDGLNRVIKRTYSAPTTPPDAYSATSDVNYYYDGKGLSSAPDFSLGKLTKVANGESETSYTKFDAAGRITESRQITEGLDVCTGTSSACIMGYQYNLAGILTEETYPSGRIVHHNYGGDGKLTAVSSQIVVNKANKSYAQNFTYNAAGAVTAMQLGNMRWESTSFNSRLQPTKIALGTTTGGDDLLNLEYTYGTSANSYHDNNGNVLTQTITVDDVGIYSGFVATQTYTYDALNRLKSATESSAPNGGSSSQSWKQTYLYDRFGNRTFDTTSGATTTLPGSFDPDIYNPTIDPATNQFETGQGYAYDAAGSVKQDATGKKFVYDGENKQSSFGTGGDDDNGGTYGYDGDGRRIRKQVGTEVTVFIYDATGLMVAEYATNTPSSPQVNYLTADALGTPRLNTDSSGAVIARHDYMPFGEEIFTVGNRVSNIAYAVDGVSRKFTGKERDAESELDFFEARYYFPEQGRFTSTDPILLGEQRLFDPQQINLYAYTRNNPLRFIDSFGEIIIEPTGLDEKHQKRYNDWKAKLLSTKEGQAKWDDYNKDTNFTLTITVEDRGSDSANASAEVKDYQFDNNGALVGAKMELGNNLGSGGGQADADYPVTETITGDTQHYDAHQIAASKIAHEFGHLDDFRNSGSRLYEEEQIRGPLKARYAEISPTARLTDPTVLSLRSAFQTKFGESYDQRHTREENNADRNAIPIIRQVLGSSITKRTDKAMKALEKTPH